MSELLGYVTDPRNRCVDQQDAVHYVHRTSIGNLMTCCLSMVVYRQKLSHEEVTCSKCLALPVFKHDKCLDSRDGLVHYVYTHRQNHNDSYGRACCLDLASPYLVKQPPDGVVTCLTCLAL